MKKHTTLSILFAATVTFLTSCNSSPSADQYLQNEHHRKGVVQAMVHHQPYMSEMMQEMMNNDSCKQMMMANIMDDPSMRGMTLDNMMNRSKTDTSMFKTMMGKTMKMCNDDTSKCAMMMGSMHTHPNVMKSMQGIPGRMDDLK